MPHPSIAPLLQRAMQFHQAGDVVQAEPLYRQALSLEPDHADALHLLGLLLSQSNRLGEAIGLMRRAITIRPDYFEAHFNLAIALRNNEQLDAAIESLQHASALRRNDLDTLVELGALLSDTGRPEQAIPVLQRALAINPNSPEALTNLANALHHVHRAREAIPLYQRALQLRPESGDVHWNYAICLLSLGEFEEGWPHFEWRRSSNIMRHTAREFSQPIWDRQDVSGKTLLLFCEGGLGDSIQFIRYLPQVRGKGAARILLECPQALHSLLANLNGVDQLIVQGQPLPPFDYHCPLPSLPYNFDTRLETIPRQVPYLHPAADRIEQWKQRIDTASATGKKVGLVWSGSPVRADVRPRDLSLYAPLANVRDVTLFSVQVGPAASQAQSPPDGIKLVDLTRDIRDMSDTAAMLMNLDLLISIDTSVAHLAGALARPVWTLIPYISDFRWLLDRSDSPWYPTMKLFRQVGPEDWSATIASVTKELHDFAAGSA